MAQGVVHWPMNTLPWLPCRPSADLDLEHCPQCGGNFKIITTTEAPAVMVKILTHLGLPARAPPRAPARRLDLFEAA